ncbi:DUF4253 domain-containing protein [Paenibacillus sp. GXUN7292]|uniref:DUF4253 domain-containing protein n=1 Tax=Paenibacillus sp. GXUN7292 TaxID=3422499 RepID=UPI003D7E83F8
MMDELIHYLKECEIETVDLDNLTLPAKKDGKHGLLVLPCYNLVEMLEEVFDEEESLTAYVHNQLAKVHSLSAEDAWRKIVESQLYYTDLPADQKNLDGKGFEGIYQAYKLIWEGHELLNEQLCEAETEPFILNYSWIQSKIEDEDKKLIVLALSPESGFEAPLWVPMGGFNECPLPEYQSVIMKHWQENYETRALAVSDDTWVLQAGRKPSTQEEALKLAKEHFMFCQYVLESYPTLGHYADYLLKHDVWYFWWD